jgi:hypothetical protein
LHVPRIGARLPLPGGLALGAQYGKLDADLRTSALLDMPSVQSVHATFRAALHGTLGSYLSDALREGNVDVVACLRVPRA